MEKVISQIINKLVYLFFCCATPILVMAQSDFQINLGYVPHYRHVRDVEIYQSHLFAIGGWERNDSIASIFRSSDNGISWNFITDNINAILEDIDFYGNSGRIVGWSGNYWKSEDGGLNWASVPMTGNLTNRDFFDAYWFSPMEGIAVGGKNLQSDTLSTIIRTEDGGDTWITVFEESGSKLKSLDFYGGLNGVCVGENGAILKSNDGGWTWQYDIVNLFNRDWEKVIVNPQNQVTLIIGGETDSDSLSTILRSTDLGDTWEVVQDVAGSKYYSAEWITGNKVMAVGKEGVKKWSEDGGLTWVDLNLNNDNDIQWNAVRFLNPGYALMGGDFGKVALLVDPSNGFAPLINNDLDFYFDTKSSNLIFLKPPPAECHLKLYDLQGKLLSEYNALNLPSMIEFSFLSSGKYLVDIEIGGERHNYKFVKP